MSYLSFLPWTLQKRLLRYLLSQLDFLETDNLDLEDLDITWGQRSVVELNNIRLRTRKLSSILRLPSFVDLTSAQISYLKLTVPADILTSGIVVEISGVEIHLKVEPENGRRHRFPRPEERTAPARGTKSNRPRIATPTIHDPGGRRAARYGSVEDALFHPELAMHKLAESFLQAESKEDRRELGAAVASQTPYGRDSLSSSTLSEEEVGLGAAEGYMMPSFIASYLVGITDRLQLHVNNITVHAEFYHSRENANYQQPGASPSTRILLRLSELRIGEVDVFREASNGGTPKRKVVLHQFNILILPDHASDAFDPDSSETNSPIFKHSQASTSSSSSALKATQALPAASAKSELPDEITDPVIPQPEGTEQPRNIGAPVSSIQLPATFAHSVNLNSPVADSALLAATSADIHPSVHSDRASPSAVKSSPILDNKIISQDPANATTNAVSYGQHQRDGSKGTSAHGMVDNQVRAEALAKSGEIALRLNEDSAVGQAVEDLTESKIFTHDEAESMYMSALSANEGSSEETGLMPGGWDRSKQQAQSSEDLPPSDPIEKFVEPVPSQEYVTKVCPRISSAIETPITKRVAVGDGVPRDSPRSSAQISQPAKELLFVDRVSAWLPAGQDLAAPNVSSPENILEIEANARNAASKSHINQYSSASGNHHHLGLGFTESQASAAHSGDLNDAKVPASSLDTSEGIEIEVMNVQIQLDMHLGKTLIAIVNSTLGTSEGVIKGKDGSGMYPPAPTLSIKVSNTELAFLECVPELSTLAAGTKHSSSDDALLLSISLSGLLYKTSSLNAALQQQIQLPKLSLSHCKGQFLSFGYDSSIIDSSKDTVTRQKNDVEISVTSTAVRSKVEVHSKPIQLTLELCKLDDILSRSGGLSSLLELGSSIASSSTFRASPKKTKERRAEPRGVRFEDFSRTELKSQDDLTFGLGKVNIRIGGLSVDVVGSECIMKASTTAVKIVHRTEGVGMQIDRVVVQGPYLLASNEGPDLSVNVQSIRMEYLPTPNDKDLDRLLAILTPSRDKYDADDDIMVDTLLRQRRKGGVLRFTVMSTTASFNSMSRMAHLAQIGNELGKLSSVAKYLPEDDRPGILTLGLLKTFQLDMNTGDPIGKLQLKAEALEGAHVSVPSLVAVQVGTASIHRKEVETLLGEAVPYSENNTAPPMIMCRFVADEMDPTVKLKLFNICLEYHVTLLAAVMKMVDSDVQTPENGSDKSSQSFGPASSPPSSESAAEFVRRTNISVAIRDSALALNPRDINGRALFVLTDATFASPLNDDKDIRISTEIKKASIMVIDKVSGIDSLSDADRSDSGHHGQHQARALTQMGYVPVGYISSATTTLCIAQLGDNGNRSIDIEFGNALLIIESCADSTQTLISILNGLSPPAPPIKRSPYRTEIMPIQDLLASFSGDAFITEPTPGAGLRAERSADSESMPPEQRDVEYVSDFYHPDPEDEDSISESGIYSEMLDSEIAESTVSISVSPVSIRQPVTQAPPDDGMTNSVLDFRDEHFGRASRVGGLAHQWDSNTSGLASERNIKKPPLEVRIRDLHIIWNLFDGYDWQDTRDIISEAVKDIQTRAAAGRRRITNRLSSVAEEEEESVIGDFLFNSIYIGIPPNKDPRELAHEINREIDDLTSESGSYATSTGSPAKHQPMRQRQAKLKLERSKQHKMTFELKGISADMLVFPPDLGEVQSSIDIKVKDLEIFDHVPTSTWKKFATYMRDAGEREADTSMIHIEILNVKPVPDLAASEMILKLTVLPLRLHVDQDALDFLSRFFEFKDENAPVQSTTSSPPFLQRVEINPVKIRLDFKPKRVDYRGLRSGRTTEFMNFFVLDQADMTLRRVILYGVPGFDRLGIMLNNIWMPDVKRNQLPGILAGLAPVRSLVNVGGGVKDLVVVPMREYKKDGRIVRSIQKGALAFAKTTSKELIGLGAKLAIGTQTVLQNAETMLAPAGYSDHPHAGADADPDDESQRHISPYAHQPIGVVQGLRGAYASLERDLLLARDAIIAVPGEAMASGSAAGAAKAILKQAPTVILRPAIGATKAVGQTLLGAGNTLDRENWRRIEDKYKRH